MNTLATIKWNDLEESLTDKLRNHLNGVIDEVNLAYTPQYPIHYPEAIELGISVEILDRTPEELPVVAFGIYERVPLTDGEQQFADVSYPYIVEAYISHEDKTILKQLSVKWGLVFTEFFQRYGNRLLPGFTTTIFPHVDATYVLRKRDGYRCLITAAGKINGYEGG